MAVLKFVNKWNILTSQTFIELLLILQRPNFLLTRLMKSCDICILLPTHDQPALLSHQQTHPVMLMSILLPLLHLHVGVISWVHAGLYCLQVSAGLVQRYCYFAVPRQRVKISEPANASCFWGLFLCTWRCLGFTKGNMTFGDMGFADKSGAYKENHDSTNAFFVLLYLKHVFKTGILPSHHAACLKPLSHIHKSSGCSGMSALCGHSQQRWFEIVFRQWQSASFVKCYIMTWVGIKQ